VRAYLRRRRRRTTAFVGDNVQQTAATACVCVQAESLTTPAAAVRDGRWLAMQHTARAHARSAAFLRLLYRRRAARVAPRSER